MSSGTVMKLELPLEAGVWNQLQHEVARSGQPTVSLASDVLAKWACERHRQRIAQEISDFAATHAGGQL
ncbi:MAG: hypothetical protein FJ267_04640, partial [Planctomycetes bacterium]|nr:hypothetical protein [Planctomycetota bacterium]